MVERSKAGAPKITVKDFDDPEARAMHDVDFDFSDSARALVRNGINIDDRTAVESALSDTAGYTHDPAGIRPLHRRGHQDGAPQYGHGPDRLDQLQFPVSFARDGERDLVGCENRRDLRRFLKEVGTGYQRPRHWADLFIDTRALDAATSARLCWTWGVVAELRAGA